MANKTKLASLLLGAALMLGVGATASFAEGKCGAGKCGGKKTEKPAKCGAGKCGGEKKQEKAGKCGGSEKGKSSKCGSKAEH